MRAERGVDEDPISANNLMTRAINGLSAVSNNSLPYHLPTKRGSAAVSVAIWSIRNSPPLALAATSNSFMTTASLSIRARCPDIGQRISSGKTYMVSEETISVYLTPNMTCNVASSELSKALFRFSQA